MGWLRDRVNTREQREAMQASTLEFTKRFTREAARAEYYDSFDEALLEGGRPARPPVAAEKRGIERLNSAYRKAYREAFGSYPEDDWMDGLNRSYEDIATVQPEEIQRTTSQSWKQEQRRDVTDNFLYQEWLLQLDERDPVRSFASYAVYVSAKAVVELLTTHKDGLAVIKQYHPAHLPIPMREKVLALKNRPDYDPDNPAWFMANAFAQVPGLWDVAQTLQVHYGDFVRTERVVQELEDDSPLPDDPLQASLPQQVIIPREQRIENAVQAFLAEEGDADTIASKYGLPQKQFRNILRERGVMRPRGGDRRGKKAR